MLNTAVACSYLVLSHCPTLLHEGWPNCFLSRGLVQLGCTLGRFGHDASTYHPCCCSTPAHLTIENQSDTWLSEASLELRNQLVKILFLWSSFVGYWDTIVLDCWDAILLC